MSHPFYTHQKYLREQLDSLDLTKPIKCLEFGSGIGSGDVFNEFTSLYPDFQVITYEHDVEWFNQMKEKYSADNYKFNLIKWEEFDYTALKNEKYDLIFVDQGVWSERARTVRELINNSDIIVVHDFDYFNKHDSGYIANCPNIYACDDTTYWGSQYNDVKQLTAYSELLPPTLLIKTK
jgi:hypothetical protein